MDELALLKDFRLEDAAADGAREHARAALQDAMNRRRLPRRYAIALAFVAAALLAAGAYAIVHEFIVGAAAPKDVNAQLEFDVGHFFDYELIPWRGHPRKTAGPTRVAAAAQTPDGPVYLLLTPLQGGGECLFTYTGREDGPPPTASCSLGKPIQPGRFVYFTQNITAAGPMIVGYAPGAVRVRYAGASFETPLGWFVVPSRVDKVLTAYGAHAGVVARVPLTRESSPPVPQSQPKPQGGAAAPGPVKPPHVIISTHTGWARTGSTWVYTHELLRVAIARDNNRMRCIYPYAKAPSANDAEVSCGWPDPRANEVQVVSRAVGWTRVSGSRRTWVSVLVLLGQAGANVAHAEVRFSDGRTAPTTLRQGVIFYQVPRENFRAGHRPAQVIGRDASGHVVARKRLPFVR
jgi:hypothetical protein